MSLLAGHRFPRDIILLAVRYYLQLGAAAERIAGVLADRGIDVSGRTILRWVQKFGPALASQVQRHRKTPVLTWLVDETYVKILGKWHYLYRGVDLEGQVLDCWVSPTRVQKVRKHGSGRPMWLALGDDCLPVARSRISRAPELLHLLCAHVRRLLRAQPGIPRVGDALHRHDPSPH